MPTDQIARDALASGANVRAEVLVGSARAQMVAQKLLRSAAVAARGNPATAAPLLASPAYQAGTGYAVGQVFTSGNSLYMVGIPGTSPASGGAPTSISSGGFQQYGGSGPFWTYLGGIRTPDPGDGAPVVTVSAASGYVSLGQTWSFTDATIRDLTKLRGGDGLTSPWVGGNSILLTAFTDPQAGATAHAGSQSFMSDSDIVTVMLPAISGSARGTRIFVDGRPLQIGNYAVPAGSSQAVEINWRTSSGKRARLYEIEPNRVAIGFGEVQTPGGNTIWKPLQTDEVKVAWINDSYGAGAPYGPFLGGNALGWNVGKRLGWRDVRSLSIGGTGYLNNATDRNTFRARVPAALAMNPDVYVLMGSTNDASVSYSAADIQAEALATFQQIRAGAPGKPIIVIGVPSINNSRTVLTENAVKAAVTQFGDPLTFFIPISTAPVPWLLSTWNNSAILGTPYNAGYYIGGDAIHPVEIGTDYLAARIEQAIRQTVLPLLAPN